MWFDAHRRVIEEFPEAIFFPSWWAEIGMAAEPSTLGVRVRFWPHQTPSEERTPFRLEDLDLLAASDPASDGFCPLILSVGGGVSPGMPAANIRAMARALESSKG